MFFTFSQRAFAVSAWFFFLRWKKESLLHATRVVQGQFAGKCKEFTIAFNEIQHIVIRSSKLLELKKRASRWTNLHRKTTPTVHCLKSSTDIGRIGISH